MVVCTIDTAIDTAIRMPDMFKTRGKNRNDANSKGWSFEILKEMIWGPCYFDLKLRQN